jgi:histone H3
MANRKVYKDEFQHITKPALGRVCSRAGIKSKTGSIYEEMRNIMKSKMEKILKNCIVFAENDRKKRVKICHLEAALSVMGMHVGTGAVERGPKTLSKCHKGPAKKVKEGSEKPHRFKSGTVSLRQIRYQQKNSDCLIFPKKSFTGVTREIGQEFSDSMGYSKAFREVFQFVIEDYLVCLMEAANLLSIHAGRHRVFVKDIELAQKIRKGHHH